MGARLDDGRPFDLAHGRLLTTASSGATYGDAANMLAECSATMRDETDLAKLTERLVAVVEETMQPPQVSLWLGQPERK